MTTPDSVPSGALHLFDRAFYRQISGILGDSITELVTDFRHSCKRFESRLVETSGEPDPRAFRELCHEIKGSAVMLGFTGLSRLAAEWEDGAVRGVLPSASDAAIRFKNIVEASGLIVADIPPRRVSGSRGSRVVQQNRVRGEVVG